MPDAIRMPRLALVADEAAAARACAEVRHGETELDVITCASGEQRSRRCRSMATT